MHPLIKISRNSISLNLQRAERGGQNYSMMLSMLASRHLVLSTEYTYAHTKKPFFFVARFRLSGEQTHWALALD